MLLMIFLYIRSKQKQHCTLLYCLKWSVLNTFEVKDKGEAFLNSLINIEHDLGRYSFNTCKLFMTIRWLQIIDHFLKYDFYFQSVREAGIRLDY